MIIWSLIKKLFKSSIEGKDFSGVSRISGISGFKITKPVEVANPITKISTDKTVAIVIGHNKFTGARAIDGTDEWSSRKIVAESLYDELKKRGVDSKIFIRNSKLGYSSAMREHGRKIDAYGASVAIELHFNSAGTTATGTEFIVCSNAGVKVARSLAKAWSKFFPDMKLRRDGGVYKIATGRGTGFCKAPACPALVYEGFFASNQSEWDKFKDIPEKEAEAIAEGLIDYLK